MLPLDNRFVVDRYSFLFTQKTLTIASVNGMWSTTVSSETPLYRLLSQMKFKDGEPVDKEERAVLTVLCDNMYMPAIVPGDAILMRERMDSLSAYYERLGEKGGRK